MAKLTGHLFARLALDYFDHPKIAGLSDAAIVAHLEMLVYARKYLTDGVIPMRIAMRFASDVLDELASNDLDNPSVARRDDGSLILYGYEDFQETKEQVESRRRSRKESAEARWSKDAKRNAPRTAPSNAPRTAPSNAETETETETSIVADSGATEAATAPPREDVESLCTLLADRIEANGSKRPNIGKGWRDAARLMLDRDGRNHTEATRLIDWSQKDDFWRTNILSMSKFRTQYDQLKLKAGPATTPRPNVGKEEWMNYA